ncbi:MAG: YkgJ family cysteine cluster protein [Haloarculaceae archaeon]
MDSLETELERARGLDVDEMADAIETIGFECTRCGGCCKAVETEDGTEEHTATVFPDEVRRLQEAGDDDYDWRDVARPMPFGLTEGADGPEGETFEWALQTDGCGDCVFYEEPEGGGESGDPDGPGTCTVHGDRPLICRTYPFSVALGGTSQPMGEAVDSAGPEIPREDGTVADGSIDSAGMVRAHECEGLGREISRADAEELAATLKERAVRELEEAIAVREAHRPVDTDGVVVHDSEGAKRPDGRPYE